MLPLQEFVLQTPVMIAAHRGSSGTAPENTLAAMRQALDDGADMIELDLQFTADGVPIVFHDTVLGRTTDGSGKVCNFSAHEISQLDAGAWFGKQFQGEKIPFLDEALDLLAGKVYISIELKPAPSAEIFQRCVSSVLTPLQQRGLLPFTLFLSFHHAQLAHLSMLYPGCHTAALHIPGDTRLPEQIAEECGCRGFVCSINELTKQRIVSAEKAGLYTGVYTVNNKKDLQKALARNVKALVTNYPREIRDLLQLQ